VGDRSTRSLAELNRWLKEAIGGLKSPFHQIVLRVDDDLRYGELLRVVDVCTQQRFANGEKLKKLSFVALPAAPRRLGHELLQVRISDCGRTGLTTKWRPQAEGALQALRLDEGLTTAPWRSIGLLDAAQGVQTVEAGITRSSVTASGRTATKRSIAPDVAGLADDFQRRPSPRP